MAGSGRDRRTDDPVVRILYVGEDTNGTEDVPSRLAAKRGRFSVDATASVTEALRRVTVHDVVISTLDLPDGDGLSLLESIRSDRDSDVPFVLFCDGIDPAVLREALNLGADRHVPRDGEESDTVGALADAVEQTQRDAGERDATEAALREARERLSAIYQSSPAAITLTSLPDGEIVEVNDAFTEITGWSAEEAVGRTDAELGFWADADDRKAFLADLRSNGRARDRQIRFQDRDGEEIVGVVSAEVVTIDGEEYTLSTTLDVTERTKRARELERQNERFRALFENMSEAVVEGRIEAETGGPVVVAVNEAFEEGFGYDRDAVRGENLDEIIVPPGRESEVRSLNEKVKQGELFAEEVQRQTADGLRTFLFRFAPIETGEVITSGYAMYTDITERKRRERELESFEVLFERATDCIIKSEVVDGKPIIRSVNAAFEDVFGYDEAEVVGQAVDELIVPAGHAEEATAINDRAREGDQFSVEVTRQTADGTREFLFRPAHFGDDLSYAIYTDITERKERERELQRQNERLDKFASMVSHDLRNPLSMARTYLEFARESHDESDFAAIDDALGTMDDMIGDLLAFAREGQTVAEPRPVDLATVVPRSWNELDPDRAELEVSDLAVVEGDESAVQNLLANLLGNAVEHGRPGAAGDGGSDQGAGESTDGTPASTDGPTVRVGMLDDGFYVVDDGPGIPESRRDKVFDHGHTTRERGTGFGLSIVESVATAHGWQVDVTESADGGARFEIRDVTVVD